MTNNPDARANLRMDRDVDALKDLAHQMAARAEAILAKSIRAAWEADPDLSIEVKSDDIEIDRLDVAIDDAVLRVLALDAPVATDLRTVIAVKAVATDLERVGDLARNIASCGRRLSEQETFAFPENLRSLADESQRALQQANQAFAGLDPDLARSVLDGDDRIDDLEAEIVRASIDSLEEHPESTKQVVDLIFIAQSLERIGDHATNIAEETILAAEAKNLKHAEKLERASD